MKLPNKTSFSAAGRDYEVRIWREDDNVIVQCFQKDEPIGVKLSVSDKTRDDFESYHGDEAVAQLVRIAVGDIVQASVLGRPI